MPPPPPSRRRRPGGTKVLPGRYRRWYATTTTDGASCRPQPTDPGTYALLHRTSARRGIAPLVTRHPIREQARPRDARRAPARAGVGDLPHRAGRRADRGPRGRDRPRRATAPEYGLVHVDASIPEADRYLVALASAVQQSGIADRIGMAQSVAGRPDEDARLLLPACSHGVAFQPIVELADAARSTSASASSGPEMPMPPRRRSARSSRRPSTPAGRSSSTRSSSAASSSGSRDLDGRRPGAGRAGSIATPSTSRRRACSTRASRRRPSRRWSRRRASRRRQITLECTEQQAVSDVVPLTAPGQGAAPARVRLRGRRRRRRLRELHPDRRPAAVDHQDRPRDRATASATSGRREAGARRGVRLVRPADRRRSWSPRASRPAATSPCCIELGVEFGQGYLIGRPSREPVAAPPPSRRCMPAGWPKPAGAEPASDQRRRCRASAGGSSPADPRRSERPGAATDASRPPASQRRRASPADRPARRTLAYHRARCPTPPRATAAPATCLEPTACALPRRARPLRGRSRRSTRTAPAPGRDLVPPRGRRPIVDQQRASAGAGRPTCGATRAISSRSHDGDDWVGLDGSVEIVERPADRPRPTSPRWPARYDTRTDAAEAHRPRSATSSGSASGSARRASTTSSEELARWPRPRSATRRCSSSSGRRRSSATRPLAEQAGFAGVMAADHFQPWVPAAGPGRVRLERADRHRRAHDGRHRARASPARASGSTRRSWPRPSATLAAMYPGRHWLGLGSGEALNEHVVGGYWPETPERIARMFEAIEIIRKLFTAAARTSSTTASTSSSRRPGSGRCPTAAAADLHRDGRPGHRQEDRACTPTASSPSARPRRRSR